MGLLKKFVLFWIHNDLFGISLELSVFFVSFSVLLKKMFRMIPDFFKISLPKGVVAAVLETPFM